MPHQETPQRPTIVYPGQSSDLRRTANCSDLRARRRRITPPTHPFSLATSLRATSKSPCAQIEKNWATGDAVDVEPRQNGRAGREAGRAPRRRPGPRAAPSGRRGRPRRWPRPQSPGPPGPGLAAVRRYPSARRRAGPAFAPRLRPASGPLVAGVGGTGPPRNTSPTGTASAGPRAPARPPRSGRARVGPSSAAPGTTARPCPATGPRCPVARDPSPAARTARGPRGCPRPRRRGVVGSGVGPAPPCARLEVRLASPRVDSLSRGPREGARPREMKSGSPRRPSDPLRQQVTRR